MAQKTARRKERQQQATELLRGRLSADFKGTMLELYDNCQSNIQKFLSTRVPEAIAKVEAECIGDSWGAKLYTLFNDMTSIPMCRVCKVKHVNFTQMSAGMNKTCSRECSAVDGEKYRLAFETGCSYKEHMLPSGKVIGLMGCEPQVVDYLLADKNLTEDDFSFDNEVPTILYEFNGKTKLYIPDFYIEPLNMICEVKSSYTYKAELAKNKAKQQAVLAAGYEACLIIWDDVENRPMLEAEALMREASTTDSSFC